MVDTQHIESERSTPDCLQHFSRTIHIWSFVTKAARGQVLHYFVCNVGYPRGLTEIMYLVLREPECSSHGWMIRHIDGQTLPNALSLATMRLLLQSIGLAFICYARAQDHPIADSSRQRRYQHQPKGPKNFWVATRVPRRRVVVADAKVNAPSLGPNEVL